MYSNIGKKIELLAKILGWLWIIAGVLWFLILLFNEEVLIGFICLLGGGCGWASTWLVFGFGQLVGDVHALRQGSSNVATIETDELPDL